jgi:hypothetical protein
MGLQSTGVILLILSSAGLALSQITTIPTGIVKTGIVSLIRADSETAFGLAPPVENTMDAAVAGFVSADYTNYTPPSPPPSIMIGACIVSTITLSDTLQNTPPTTIQLDGGPVINVNGPNGAKQIPQRNGVYFAQVGGGIPLPIPGFFGPMPLYLDPGTYTIDNGGGGADVGPFTATLNVPSPGFVWTNADANLTIDRSAGIDIQWSGGDPATNVLIHGVVGISGAGGSFGSLDCSAPNTGEFFVTPDLLSLLPATSASGSPGAISTLAVTNASMTTFSAAGIDVGIFSYQAGYSRTVVYQ